jgi:hypothetical protein
MGRTEMNDKLSWQFSIAQALWVGVGRTEQLPAFHNGHLFENYLGTRGYQQMCLVVLSMITITIMGAYANEISAISQRMKRFCANILQLAIAARLLVIHFNVHSLVESASSKRLPCAPP